MPLSKARQAEYMREYRQRMKANTEPSRYNVIPNKTKIAELQSMIHTIENSKPVKSAFFDSSIPWYNPEIHSSGDKVKQFNNGHVEVVTL